MKIQKLKLLSLVFLLASLIVSSCNSTEKTTKSKLDKVTGQLVKETEKIKGCLYSDGSICNQTCCKTGNSCGSQLNSYKKCDISTGSWGFEVYKNSGCSSFCIITDREIIENKNEPKKETETKTTISIEGQNKEIEEKKIITCSSGWKCKDENYKGYQISDCSWLDLSYCNEGCKSGECVSKKEITEPAQEPITEPSVIVLEIIDGDTIELNSGEKVRLIGINAPEAGQYYYLEAKNKLKELIEGKTIILEKDISNTDRYGRLLRYIYVDNLFVNLEMIKLGYAEAYRYPPDVKFSSLFEEAENEAKAKGLGIWKREDINYIVDKCFNVINFHYDATGNDNYNLNDEYFTLENSCSYSIDLTGWMVKDEATHIYKFYNLNLGANAQVTIYTGSGQDTSTELYWKMSSAVWNNDGDTLFLRDSKGNLVLEKKY